MNKTLRIQVRRRRFAFRFGLSAAAVKEYPSSPALEKLASFAVALRIERDAGEVRRLIRTEILKRIGGGAMLKSIYQDPMVTIYQGDCAEILASLEEVSAIVTDPPYGINAGFDRRGLRRQRGLNGHSIGNREWRKIEGDDKPFDPAGLLRFRFVALSGANHYADKLPPQNPAKPWKWLVWDKRAGSAPDNNSDAELWWTNQYGALRVHYQKWRGVVREGEENLSRAWKLHPAQKPISLMRWVIGQLKLPMGTVIVDPYCGSGTTCRAAKDLGYKSIGVEIEQEWAESAARRMPQGSLLAGVDF